MYIHCVFFHTILAVAQNTQICILSVIPECNSFSLVINTICDSLGHVLCTPGPVEQNVTFNRV